MDMHSETHHMFVQILICVSAAYNNSLVQYTFTSINLCIWEQNLEQKILAYFNSMMAVGVSCSTSLESTTGIACPPCFLINFLKATKEEFTLKKIQS